MIKVQSDSDDISSLIDSSMRETGVTGLVAGVPFSKIRWQWMTLFLFSLSLVLLFIAMVTVLFVRGVGIWGINIPVAWGTAIINFVWWIGIGHAGTFISAFLYLMHRRWRASINRFAEAMTLFAVACAGLMPLLHLGRPWLFYYLLPYPDTMGLWPQWRSALVWDVFAVSTYGLVSLIFFYTGLIPDLATMRDYSQRPFVKKIYGCLALGWRGSARHWERWNQSYLILAGLATPLVISVHSVVALDFAITVVPGWHSTIFPPYFVAGAIFSGFAMVLTLAIPLRRFFHLESVITLQHFDFCARLMLVNGLIVAYGYLMDTFMALYSGNVFELQNLRELIFGSSARIYWTVIVINVGVTQFLWFRRVRSSEVALFLISILANIGMWLERYMIVVTSLEKDFLPSAWREFSMTKWDFALLFGTIGLFLLLFLIFVRVLPAVSMSECKELLHEQKKMAES